LLISADRLSTLQFARLTTTGRRWLTDGRPWLVAAALLVLLVCIDATGDPDVWWHLRTGQWIADNLSVPHAELYSYTAAGAPWVVHEWLSELIFWLVYRGVGLAGLAVVVGLIAWSGLLALAKLARQHGARGISIGLVLLLGAKALQPVTGTRPQMFTFALLCWTLVLLDSHVRRGGRRIWLLIPLFLLWANLHAGFAVGLGILGLALVGALLDALWQHRVDGVLRRRLGEAAVALTLGGLVALLNPNGINLYRLAVSGSTPAAHRLIQEWQPPNLTSWSMLPLGLLILGTVGSMLINRHRVRPSHIVLTVIGAAAALVAVRNTAIAVALLSPTLAELLPVRYKLPSRPIALPLTAIAAGAVLVVASVISVAGATRGPALARILPSCLLANVAAAQQPVRLWLPYGQSGYAIDVGWPHLHVYAYGEDTTLGAAVITNYVRIASGQADGPPTAAHLLERSGTNAVITPPGKLSTELERAGWRSIAVANGETLFISGDLITGATVSC
jgi:hypothetical protein